MNADQKIEQLVTEFGSLKDLVASEKKEMYERGRREVVADANGGKIYDEEELQAKLAPLATKVAALEAELEALKSQEAPADTTPYSQEDVDKFVDEANDALEARIADLETELSQKDVDTLQEAMADEVAALAQKFRDMSVKTGAPVEASPAPGDNGGETIPRETPMQ